MVDPILPQILGIVFVVGVPAIALATHFVLRPLVRDITQAIQTNKQGTLDADTAERLARLEDAYYNLDRQVTRLVEAEEFRRQLESGRQG
jgi:hypothetical protein